MKKHFALIILATLLMPSLSKAKEIRQESFKYHMNMARDISCLTFVIGEFDTPGKRVAADCRLFVVHFQLGSATLSPFEAETIISRLNACGITRSAPLVITGYTCELGPDHLNQTLSLQRARAVAGYLQSHGFAATAVQGRGSNHPRTENPDEFFRNRRVEIQVILPRQQFTPVPGS
ncbi:MAG: OmpA family protein [Desulfobulbaceae bacterium]|nr:OmpA family protein [Desulfobulbaceae bacterium]